MNIWFTSDLHFGHERIIELCNRPFRDADEMNAALIERWNSRVQPGDTVYVLGDVALGPISKSLPLVAQLNGNKLLVPGNHDRCFTAYRRKGPRPQDFEMYRDAGFAAILPERVFVRGCWRTQIVDWLVSHFPYAGDHTAEDRYADHRPVDDGHWLIHGHVHNLWKINGRQINVGVDVWDFYPVSIDDLRRLMEKSGNTSTEKERHDEEVQADLL